MRRESSRQVLLALERLQSANVGSAVVSFDRDFDKVQVVTPAQVLMVIVPQDAQVSAEVVIDNKDIGFVQAGQVAAIKLETFPFTRYGTVDAVVRSVTADAVSDDKKGAIFPALLTLKQSAIDVDGKRIRLSPGMNVTAEIKTGKRRVIEYLLSCAEGGGGEFEGEMR